MAATASSRLAQDLRVTIRQCGFERRADKLAADQPVMPVNDPATTLAEITAAVRAHLPGATVRRRLFFRYTLRWDKPPVTAPLSASGGPAGR